MSGKPVVLRGLARQDIEEAVTHYLPEASSSVALSFVDALDAASRHIGEHPASGSPRYASELDLPGIRSLALRGFPYPIFYFEREADIDVWRVLQAARDIPAWLREPIDD